MQDFMNTLVWEDVVPSLIPHTTMRKRIKNGVATYYNIVPEEGYVLHDKGRDVEIEIEDNPEQIELHRGYTKMGTTCGINYSFDIGTLTLENGDFAISYGEQQYFAIPIGSVEEKYIY